MHSELASLGDYIDFLKRMMEKRKDKIRRQSHNVLIAQPDFELVGDTSASASRVLGL